MERQLATIQKIKSLEPIIVRETGEEANSIVLAQILGWSVIVKKNEFQVGDLCVFFEIDSILPDKPEYEFMRTRGMHVKTMKLGSMRYQNLDAPVISQGLALPVSVVDGQPMDFYAEGEDVTEKIGVKQYETYKPASQERGIKSWNFHPIVPKTDEPRIQSYPAMLDQLQGKPYYITQKMDGTSCTVVYEDETLKVYSRNLQIGPENERYMTAFKCGVIDAAIAMPGYAIQGEVCGPNIQKNRLGLSRQIFYAFNVYNVPERRYLNYGDFRHFCEFNLIETVPILEYGDEFRYTQDDLDKKSRGTYSNGYPMEGIVIRAAREGNVKGFERLSFKYINPEFLLRVGE